MLMHPDCPLADFTAKLARIPLGSSTGWAHGRRYLLTRLQVAGGGGEKLIGEAADGSDYISLNLYHLRKGKLLRPCEMSARKVIDFVQGLEFSPPGTTGQPD
ncbi:hypothetical protein [Roseibacillus ishigakijimensis]|uniref:Peptide methionine sulfoxide reductase n=1 Tax=Roseibacillus ishigakijimensis TaxID=454146 RepID=A0A934RMF0_9BACT|nr:hypothetical protein [Roseibacillus ishigakijimensis]MBK1834472.1 hypothetical protein [Roseibacillus ishigakijimensis]